MFLRSSSIDLPCGIEATKCLCVFDRSCSSDLNYHRTCCLWDGVWRERSEVAQVLLLAKANIDVRDKNGNTAEEVAGTGWGISPDERSAVLGVLSRARGAADAK